jgi:glycyl-tRNA synthetase beta subunit
VYPQVLGEELPAVVASLQFPKSMRWSTQVRRSVSTGAFRFACGRVATGNVL